MPDREGLGRPEMEAEKLIREEADRKAVERDRILRAVKPGDAVTRTPKLRDEALYGPHGDYVRAVEGKTEATTPAILATLLSLYGCWSGKRAWVTRGEAQHGPNVSSIIVGVSAHSLKGTSRNVALKPYQYAEAIDVILAGAVPLPRGMQSADGFASGEALIDRLAPDEDPLAPKKDPRLVVFETEFAAQLKRMGRDGSTLGPVNRQIFDGTRLSTHSRGHGMKIVEPDDYWLATIGHITDVELASTLDKAQLFGGTVNRYLWWHAPRSSVSLAFEEPIPRPVVEGYAAALRLGTPAPPPIGEVHFALEARDLWVEMNRELKADDPRGLLSHVVGRNRPQVLRLAVNYMLSMGRREIGVDDLRAARAVWDYCRDSAWLVFGTRTGDTAVDALVRWLADEEQAGTASPDELRAEFGNQYRVRVEKAEEMGLVRKVKLSSAGPGRKPVRYELST